MREAERRIVFQVDKAKSQEKRHSVALPVSEYVSSLRKLSLPDCGENLVREGGAQIKKYRKSLKYYTKKSNYKIEIMPS